MGTRAELLSVGRRTATEFVVTLLVGPVTLLILRQAFVHDHQAIDGPFVHWSLSAVMVLGDTALVLASTLGNMYWYGLQVRGDARLLPKMLTGHYPWVPFFWLMLLPAHLVLIEADPFADQLALKPHAWIFQYAHVIFGAYISARLIVIGLQEAWTTIIRLQRYHRYGSQSECYTPIPVGNIICVMAIIGLVVYFGAIFWSHPHDIHLTTRWLG